MSDWYLERKNLAAMLASMSYGALRQVGEELASTCEDKEARPTMVTAKDFADLLADWGEANQKE